MSADGSHAADVKQWAAQAEAEVQLAAAEAAVCSGQKARAAFGMNLSGRRAFCVTSWLWQV